MKQMVAEDGIAPTHQPSYAGKATSLTLPYNLPQRSGLGQVCVMREDRQERERRDDTNGLQAVSLYLPQDTILRLLRGTRKVLKPPFCTPSCVCVVLAR